ncbi:MAG: pyruvate:ferredoxin (flavodoxin) oxidoreductase [Bacteroidetes bacterium]|jgi:pyruvate-ferredoxin/flavodoxin oxidoreductase|nr:pyruvate:ferredoxin (flavodoxin) oxidoreductase [Bacteroidota bacterium]MBT5530913.1 pyruvate:ferredoxin (flavodoxin) oxidoreductase [Cytophagia bacterium]
MANKRNFITCEGNMAAAHIAYMFSEVAAIYPITPSSNMAEYVDEWASSGRKNLFGETVEVSEMQSEGGASGAVHGALQAGALTSTYTASQGLLLMIPNMYKIAGELLPGVFHVSARSVAAHALSIFGDHSDIYATRQTGFALLSSGSVQQIMDLAGVAHLAAIKSRIPFVHFFDGFRSSHEIQKVEALTEDDFRDLVDWDALQKYRDSALNPENPVTRGTAQNPDIFFQAKEAVNRFYDPVADIVNDYMQDINKLTGRDYKPFTYYGAADADNIIVAMASVTETIQEVVDYLNARGEKVGLITCHLYRPFSEKYFFNVLPKSVKKIAVLDRTKEPGANGEPLYLDIRDIFFEKENRPIIVGGRYGLSSKDTVPSMIQSVYENLKLDNPKNRFTVGINDDVTNLSLPLLPNISVSAEGTYEAKFYGLGADGTVGANKNSIKIIGDSTDKFCQGYFAYDSKKSGGFTASHLRFGDHPIRSTYLVTTPDFVACHVPSYLDKYDMLKGLKKGGTFLLNSIWDAEETKNRLPDSMKKYLAENEIKFYIINATKIADEIGLGNRTNTIMQAAFFKVAEVIPYEQAVTEMKNAIKKSYGRKGEEIVTMNNAAVDNGGRVEEVAIPKEWAKIEVKRLTDTRDIPEFIKNVVEPINAQNGDDLPVSAFLGREDGTFPAGTTEYEKRGIAVNVPEWQHENCIQCNQCSYVCPHAAIRPFILTEEEAANVPEGTVTVKGLAQLKEYQYRIQVSVLDCTGCGNCADVCPGNKVGKALEMKPLGDQLDEIDRWNHMEKKVGYKEDILPKEKSVKNSQFAQPLFEFSGACAGCGETPYIKTITQLYGERMMVANATGCSSIYGGSAPSTPYREHYKSGHGPAWANSLFEDNAEYGYGMAIAINKLRDRIARKMQEANGSFSDETKALFAEWIENKEDGDRTREVTEKLLPLLANEKDPLAKELLQLKHYFIKKSVWIFGGDGWAYDIGFGGLDHVLASGENVNVLVVDTEVYSNTGGQASKATPVGAVAKFAASGMKTRKKDLGAMAMTYGYIYVAQVAMGASQSQYFKALKEAEAYPGPSLIIAYAPCINHGLKKGMGKAQEEMDDAVKAGYWHNYRYNPLMEAEGKNPFTLDSKEPDWTKFQEFLNSEVRYTSLKKAFPEEASRLFVIAEKDAKWRYDTYKRLAEMDFSK